MYGNDYTYANSRLNGTIVRRGDNPVVVTGIGRDGTVHYETVITRRERTCNLKELDVSSPELGMVNGRDGLLYLSRCPKRDDWRQGLRRNNIAILWGKHLAIDNRLIYRAIRGRYPSFEGAIEQSMEEGISVAFHRHWAVKYSDRTKRINLLYKWYDVAGSVDIEGRDLELNDNERFQFSHLVEAFEEATHECN